MMLSRPSRFVPWQTAIRSLSSIKDTFVIRKGTSAEDFQFVARMSKKLQWGCVGVHTPTHVGPIVKPGFLIGWWNGQRTGCNCAIKFGERDKNGFAFVGFNMTEEHFRNKGYGLQLMENLLAWIGDWDLVCDSALHNVSRYEKLCGSPFQNYLIREYTISCSRLINTLGEQPRHEVEPAAHAIIPIGKFDFKRLSTYDATIFGFPRHEFLRKWITIPESTGLLATNGDGDIVGYGLMQPSVISGEQVIGPLFSDNDDVTRLLLYSLAKAAIETGRMAADTAVKFTVPAETNRGVTELVEQEIGYNYYWDMVRMYSNGIPPSQALHMKKVVAFTSLSLS